MDILEPIVQAGFAGTTAVLIGIVVWGFKKMLNVLTENTKVIATFHNGMGDVRDDIKRVSDDQKKHIELTRQTYEKIISRPCVTLKEG